MYYHNITYPDMNNGEGLRAVLWLSGCSHKCHNCQNPKTWEACSGIPFDQKAREELFMELDRDYISGVTLTGGDPLFEKNLDGVLDLVSEINMRYNKIQNIVHTRGRDNNIQCQVGNETGLSRHKKSIWVYTGYKWEHIFAPGCHPKNQKMTAEEGWKRRQIVSQCDVLVDGRYIHALRDITLPYRGSQNQRVIDIQKSLELEEAVLWCN